MKCAQLLPSIAAAAAAAMVTAPYAAMALPSHVWVSTNHEDSYVNIRASASTRSAIQGKSNNTSQLNVMSKAKDNEGYHWYQIRSEQAQGWVRSDFLSFAAPVQLSDNASVCQSTVEETQSHLESIPNVTFKQLFTNDIWHQGVPHQRTQVYTFAIDGQGVTDVMNSQVMSSQLAGQVIANCPSVGLVIFNSWGSDWIAEYGLMPGGLIRQFTNCPAVLSDIGRIPVFADPQWGDAACI